MEIIPTFNGGRPDPEVQAGRALRRLREERGWTQEEVARRMRDYGYEFHQTMIAKIEAAQRPLRVRELADFAALYGVEVQDLIYAPSGSPEETAKELAEVEERRKNAGVEAHSIARRLHQVHEEANALQAEYDSRRRDLAVLDERLVFLRGEAEKFARWAYKPDPSAAGTEEELHGALREFWKWAGTPPLSEMAARAGSVDDSTMADALRGSAPLATDVVAALIRGCGGGEKDVEAFVAASQRVRFAKG